MTITKWIDADTAFVKAFDDAVEADMEAHHERMHQRDLAKLAEFDAANPEYDYQAALDAEIVEEGKCCPNCGIPHAIHGDECDQEFGNEYVVTLDDEMLAELDAEREDNFNARNGNLQDC